MSKEVEVQGHPPAPFQGGSIPEMNYGSSGQPKPMDLYIEPGAAELAAKACRDLIEKLHERAKMANHLSREVDFGQCLEGWALSKKFSLKAKGTPESAYELIQKAQRILEDMAQAYESAGRAYAEQERQNAAGLLAIDIQNIPDRNWTAGCYRLWWTTSTTVNASRICP